MKSRKARAVWVDMRQPPYEGRMDAGAGEGETDALLRKKREENWWPGMRRWHLGLWCDEAVLELGEPESFVT